MGEKLATYTGCGARDQASGPLRCRLAFRCPLGAEMLASAVVTWRSEPSQLLVGRQWQYKLLWHIELRINP